MADETNQPPPPNPVSQSGPLDRVTALRILQRADDLLEAGETEDAARHYQRVIGFDEPAVTASALFGLGNAFYRLDREDDAQATWKAVLAMPETPSTYLAWRQIAAMRVRDGDLTGAIKAYREADRRAPAADKAEIASRLGWLAKETGDTRGAARQFRRSRGAAAITLTYVIIAVTAVVSFTAWAGQAGSGFDLGPLYPALWLDKADIASGQLWRLFTVTLVHSPSQTEFFLHLGFNMYALYLVGPVVEQIYGAPRMLLMYLASAATGSTLSFVLGPDVPGVGASGAVFGLFGVLLIASRVHNPVVDRRSRAILGQVGMLIVLNLVLGFGLGGAGVINIDNAAHVGGLLGGLWLGLILLPSGAPTLSRFWQGPAGSTPAGKTSPMLQLVGVAALVVVVAVGLVIGTDSYRQAREVGAPAVTIHVAAPRPG